MILEVALDRARGDVERDRRRRVEVVAGALVAHPRAAVAGAPEREVGLGIVGAGDPHRTAAGLPLVALRPRLAARFARRRHGVRPPRLLAGLGVKRRDEAANAHLAARCADHDLAVGDERRHRHVVPVLVSSTLAVQTSSPVLASSATSTASPDAKNTLSRYSATPRLVAWRQHVVGQRPFDNARASPVFASIAITWLAGVATNMTPLLTMGGASWPLVTPVANTHAGCSRETLAGAI